MSGGIEQRFVVAEESWEEFRYGLTEWQVQSADGLGISAYEDWKTRYGWATAWHN